MKSESLTLVLVYLAGILEKADEAVLPAVYKEVGEALNTDPTGLGTLTLFRSLVQCACYPLAAYLAVRYNRAHIIAVGAFLWAVPTFFVAISTTYLEVAVARGLNGIGLAIVIPAIQSLVADSTNDSNRGTAFGWLQSASNFGYIVGGQGATVLASTSFLGIPGWRVAFHLIAIISVIIGILVGIWASDPRFSDCDSTAKDQTHNNSFWIEIKDLIREAKMVMKIPSFQVIVAQGLSGSFPSSALSFGTMWLELTGFSNDVTALLMTLYWSATVLGSLFGGVMGDVFSNRLPNSGRVILSQISSSSTIPLAAVLLLLLPDNTSTAFPHGLVLFIMGFFMSWSASGTNNPIFAEIVPERSRTSIYALDRTFESIISAFASTIVGILAQHVFGYKPPTEQASEVVTDRENAAALAKALYVSIGIPMAICCFIYSFLYCTYPRDRERARMDALIAPEMQQLVDDDDDHDSPSSSTDQMYSELPHGSNSKTKDGNESSEMGIEFAREENIDWDDNNQASLLSHQPKI